MQNPSGREGTAEAQGGARTGRAQGARVEDWLGGLEGLEVTLAVERRGEGHVVQSTGYGVRAGVRGHSRDAVLSLVRWQLPAQLVHRDVVLRREWSGQLVRAAAKPSSCELHCPTFQPPPRTSRHGHTHTPHTYVYLHTVGPCRTLYEGVMSSVHNLPSSSQPSLCLPTQLATHTIANVPCRQPGS